MTLYFCEECGKVLVEPHCKFCGKEDLPEIEFEEEEGASDVETVV